MTAAEMLDGRVPTAPGARRVWNLPVLTRPGRVYLLEDGTTLIAREDGGMDTWPPFGRRSIASDPDPLPRSIR